MSKSDWQYGDILEMVVHHKSRGILRVMFIKWVDEFSFESLNVKGFDLWEVVPRRSRSFWRKVDADETR